VPEEASAVKMRSFAAAPLPLRPGSRLVC